MRKMFQGTTSLPSTYRATLLGEGRIEWPQNWHTCAKAETAYWMAYRLCDKSKKAPEIRGLIKRFGGEGGIRTHGTLQYA